MLPLQISVEPKLTKVLSAPAHKFFFMLPSGRRTCVALDAILHISKSADEVILHTADKCYSLGHRLKEIHELLPADRFFRISKDHVVALRFISSIDKNRVLVNGRYLLISPYYKELFYNALEKMVRGGL